MILTPEYVFRCIESITPGFLAQHGITALVLDVDNTLTADGSQVLDDSVRQWLDTMRAAGVSLTIVSNNTDKRVRPFAQRVGLAYVPLACKPFSPGLRVAVWALPNPGWRWSATKSSPTALRQGCTAFPACSCCPAPRTTKTAWCALSANLSRTG